MFKLKSLQQSLEQEEAEHKATKAKLADKNTIYQSIEEEKSAALKGEQENRRSKHVKTVTKIKCCSDQLK